METVIAPKPTQAAMIELMREGRRIAIEVHGDSGTPVVCIPGLGDTRASYRALAPKLVEAGHRVYTMDLRGHGDSEVGFASYTAADIGDDIVALLEQEDLQDAVLVGNSIGGGAICRAAADAPDRVAQLVMLNPFLRDMSFETYFRPLVPLVFAQPWAVFAWGLYRNTLFITRPDDQADNQTAVLANLREPGRMAAVRGMLRASKADIAARLSEIRAPILVVMGADDPDYSDPVAEGETLRELLPGEVQVEVIDATGHYPQIEHPDTTASLILSRMESLRHGA